MHHAEVAVPELIRARTLVLLAVPFRQSHERPPAPVVVTTPGADRICHGCRHRAARFRSRPV
eukprot:51478-Eustigmatos_ZCMA.PRE.1